MDCDQATLPGLQAIQQAKTSIKLPATRKRSSVEDQPHPIRAGTMTYCVENAALVIDCKPLLTTRLGSWLLKRGWWNIALLINCLICVFLFFAPLGGAVDAEAFDIDGELRVLTRAHALQSMSSSILTIFGIFLLAHKMNRQMFLTCCLSFDGLVILSSGAMIQLVWHINWYTVFIRSGAWQWYDIALRFLEFVAAMSIYVPMATMDSITMRYSRRIFICVIVVLSFLAEFMLCRFELRFPNFFADETLDWWIISTTPYEIYLSCKLQLLLFLCKGAVAYSRGQPFSCIKADYCVPGRQVRVERFVRSLSDSITPSSCRSWRTMSTSSNLGEVPTRIMSTSSVLGELATVIDEDESAPEGNAADLTPRLLGQEGLCQQAQKGQEDTDVEQQKSDKEWEVGVTSESLLVVVEFESVESPKSFRIDI